MFLNREEQAKSIDASEIELLENRLAEVRQAIAESKAAPPPEVFSLVDRLDTLIGKTKQHFDSNGIPIKKIEGQEDQPSI